MTRQTATPLEPHDFAACRCCGAVLPSVPPAATRFDQVLKNEHAKRALEVALTGGFSIAITGVGASYPEALAIAQVARHNGLAAYCLAPCPCGNFGAGDRACTCTPTQIARMRVRKDYQRAVQAVIHTETLTPAEARLAPARYGGEPDERILERIAWAQRQPRPVQHDAAADRLMTAAVRQLDLASDQIAQLWQIAAAIAQLAGSAQIGPAHLAEAIQYRGRQALTVRPVA